MTDYSKTIRLAPVLCPSYPRSIYFHCYWNGQLNEKHFYSILSCHYFHQEQHTIILWLENNIPNDWNDKIKPLAQIRPFILNNEKKEFDNRLSYSTPHSIPFHSDFIRLLLLYNYGGCWFDLDIFFLRNFNGLFYHFGNEICVYQWETQNYPNNAIFISLEPQSKSMKHIIEFLLERQCGFGFQVAQLTYDLPLDLFVLPCSWFDPDWIPNPYPTSWDQFFEHTDMLYNWTNFFPHSFCYHWHNRWEKEIQPNCILLQLVQKII